MQNWPVVHILIKYYNYITTHSVTNLYTHIHYHGNQAYLRNQGNHCDAHTHRYKIVTMHSLLTSDEQTQAFRSTGSATKIVLATNIAESGITIPDIVYVIDTGRVKETRYVGVG